MGENHRAKLALIILPTISGSISLFCSLMLCIRLIRHRRTLLKKVKERLLLGMSLLDILFSLGCIMSTFAGPSYLLETDELYQAFVLLHPRGTRETCNLQGWLYQLGSGTPLYNASLCFYYYLAICQNMSDSRIQVWIEPLMHFVIWSWGLTTASVAVALNLIWYSGYNGCFIFDPTRWVRCDIRPDLPDCQQSFNREVIVRVLTLPSNIISILSIVVFVSLIFYKVKRTEQNVKKWSFFNNEGALRQQQISRRTNETYICNRKLSHDGVFSSGHSILVGTLHYSNDDLQPPSPQTDTKSLTTTTSQQEQTFLSKSVTTTTVTIHPSCHTKDDIECPSIPSRQEFLYEDNYDSSISVSAEMGMKSQLSAKVILGRRALLPVSAIVPYDNKNRTPLVNIVKETGVQYVVGYLITYIPIIIQLFITDTNLIIHFVVAITLPLQGFWNWLFYTRGRLRVLRARRNGERTMMSWKAQLYTIFFE